MPYPHPIRLRGPWQFEVIERSTKSVGKPSETTPDITNLSGRVTLPSDWGKQLGPSFRGRVLFARNFGRPAGLDPHERVRLACDGIDPGGVVSVNGRRLGESAGYALPSSYDVTDLLRPRNTVELAIDFPADSTHPRPGREHMPGGPIGEVRLEIFAAHRVDDFWLEVRDDGHRAQLAGGGLVAGPTTEHPLEIIIRGPSREWLYRQVPAGQGFEITAPADDLPLWSRESDAAPVEELTVKLLDGGLSVWQRTFLVARRPVAWHAEANALQLAGHSYGLPIEIRSSSPRPSNQPLANRPLLFSPQIMPDDWYTRLDRSVIPIVQQVPVAWSGIVCRRLAHHPSIVAWVPSVGDIAALPAAAATSTFGRPWIVLDSITA